MPSAKNISPQKAREIAEEFYDIKVSLPTMIKYISVNKLGRQLGGKHSSWIVSERKLRGFLDGKKKE